jgi:hypothetical protein
MSSVSLLLSLFSLLSFRLIINSRLFIDKRKFRLLSKPLSFSQLSLDLLRMSHFLVANTLRCIERVSCWLCLVSGFIPMNFKAFSEPFTVL